MPVILVDVFVPGRPKTKGSLTFIAPGYARDSDASRHWRALMAGAVRDDYRARCIAPVPLRPAPYAGPVRVSIWAYLPIEPLATGAGDLDKLLRNVLDAIASDSRNPRFNGGAIVNDNQVTRLGESGKIGPSERPGVAICIETVDSTATVG